jgi:hypothetical protein
MDFVTVTLSSYVPAQVITVPRASTALTAACTELKAAVPHDRSIAPALADGETYTVLGPCAEECVTAAFAMPGASKGNPVAPAAASHVNA